MSFQKKQIWMSLIGFQTLLSPEEIVDVLAEHDLKAELADGEAQSGFPWKMMKFQSQGNVASVIVHCELFSAEEKEVSEYLSKLTEMLPADDKNYQRIRKVIDNCQFIAQTTKYGTHFEMAAELEYALQSCFCYSKVPDEGEGLWLLHSEKALAVAKGEDILMQMDPAAYDRCFQP